MTDNYYRRPETSNSDLTSFDYVGARNYNYNKNRLIDDKDRQLKDTKSMKKGRAVHNRILLPDYYIDNYLPMNVEYPKAQQKGFCDAYVLYTEGCEDMDDTSAIAMAMRDNYKITDAVKSGNQGVELVNKFKAYIKWKRLERTEYVVLTPQEHADNEGAYSALVNDPGTARYLVDGDSKCIYWNERDAFWSVEWSNVPLRSRLDKVIIDVEAGVVTLVDIKTARSVVSKYFLKAIEWYKYHKQLSFYVEALKTLLFEEFGKAFTIKVVIVAVEMSEPYDRNVFWISEDRLEQGEKLWKDQLQRFSWHYDNDIWIDREYHEQGGIWVEATKEMEDEEEIEIQ